MHSHFFFYIARLEPEACAHVAIAFSLSIKDNKNIEKIHWTRTLISMFLSPPTPLATATATAAATAAAVNAAVDLRPCDV